MTINNATGDQPARPVASTAALVPDLVDVIRGEHYGATRFKADALAGLTVAIVALPLSMAIAIASGLPPERGLFTAIVGGFLISIFGGSRHQVGGPAGAFIVLVAAVLQRHGYDGLVLATALAGVMMMVMGFFRLGTLVKLVPIPVLVGFTAGIAFIIFASQIKELLGLTLASEPSELGPKFAALWGALGTIKLSAVAVSLATMALILGIRKIRPNWPSLLIAIVVAGVLSYAFQLDVATIGSRFGGVPRTLPAPSFPDITWARVLKVLPDAVAIALLGAIESLLSAVVADKMSGRNHRSNMELVAQGGGNIVAVIFGGMPVTGTIARTATNVRAGATSPVAGALHSIYLLVFMLLAAGLAVHVPLAGLAAILAITAWNMAERREIAHLLRDDRAGAAVMLVTAGVTLVVDLLAGIAAGIAVSVLLTRLGRRATTADH